MEFDPLADQNLTPERPKLTYSAPVTLVGGGATGGGDLALALTIAPHLVAVDGGADTALGAGFRPDHVIGDLDSISEEARGALDPDRVLHIAEQTSTDFDKALSRVSCALRLAVGFTGARIDHELAAYHALLAHPGRRCILLGCSDIVTLAPPDLSLDLPLGSRVSLFPMAAVTGQSEGLKWPLDDIAFHPARRIGTSNTTTQSRIRLRFDAPSMLLILPRAALSELSSSLMSPACKGWNAV